MIGYNASAHSKQLFEAQFEPYRQGYAYRKNMKGPAIPITADERNRFVGNYVRFNRYGIWMMVAAMAMLAFTATTWSTATHIAVSDGMILGAVIVLAMAFLVVHRWFWTAPARELALRTPISDERSGSDAKRVMLKRTRYRYIIGMALVSIWATLDSAAPDGWNSGWGRLWLGLAGLFVVGFSLQLFRKWRFDRAGAAPKDDLGFPLSRE
jgi:hypothetical protein